MLQSESFQTVFRSMALHEGVSEQQIVMFLNDRTIQPYDKPEDVNLHIADIIGNETKTVLTENKGILVVTSSDFMGL